MYKHYELATPLVPDYRVVENDPDMLPIAAIAKAERQWLANWYRLYPDTNPPVIEVMESSDGQIKETLLQTYETVCCP